MFILNPVVRYNICVIPVTYWVQGLGCMLDDRRIVVRFQRETERGGEFSPRRLVQTGFEPTDVLVLRVPRVCGTERCKKRIQLCVILALFLTNCAFGISSPPSLLAQTGPLELHKFAAPRISRRSAHEVGKFTPTHRPPLPPS